MTDKRRKSERVRASIPIEWGVTEEYPRQGKIVSLSAEGCLVRTQIEPLYGKTILLRFLLTKEPQQLLQGEASWMSLQGEVIYYLRDVGFAMRFAGMSDEAQQTIEELVSFYREHPVS